MTEWKSRAGKFLRIEKGDITRVRVDAIVNAANSALAGGGGVDGAIHRAAGPSVMEELSAIRRQTGSLAPGNAVVTKAGALSALYIFHAVGPIYRGGGEGEANVLASCYRNCFRLAQERDVKSIAFPAISTGVYGYPVEEAAEIAIRETRNFLDEPSSVEEVRLVVFSAGALQTFDCLLRN